MAIPKKAKATPKTKLTLVESSKPTSAPLIIEPHPSDYSGFPFVTLIQYRKQPILAIVDNVDADVIRAFVLDYCGPEGVDEDMLIVAAAEWYESNRSNFPISIEFSRKGLTPITSKIYRTLNTEFVSRVIGPMPCYPMNTVRSIKRRRRKTLTGNIEIKTNSNVLTLEDFFK